MSSLFCWSHIVQCTDYYTWLAILFEYINIAVPFGRDNQIVENESCYWFLNVGTTTNTSLWYPIKPKKKKLTQNTIKSVGISSNDINYQKCFHTCDWNEKKHELKCVFLA